MTSNNDAAPVARNEWLRDRLQEMAHHCLSIPDDVADTLGAEFNGYSTAVPGISGDVFDILIEATAAIRALQSQQVASADRGEADYSVVPPELHGGDETGQAAETTDAAWANGWNACRSDVLRRVSGVYAATPPSPAESAEGDGDCPFYSGGECSCGNDQHPYFRFAAAPSGVSDAAHALNEYADLQDMVNTSGGTFPVRLNGAHSSASLRNMAAALSQPQPGRVEGMVLVNRAEFLEVLQRSDWRTAPNRAELYRMLAAAPTAGGAP